jgi:hypothetical protein
MYACILEIGRGFFEGCAGKRIGHSLFATLPHYPGIRELLRPYRVCLARLGTITDNVKLLRLTGSWGEGATIYAAVLADSGNRRPAEESYERGEVAADGVPRGRARRCVVGSWP